MNRRAGVSGEDDLVAREARQAAAHPFSGLALDPEPIAQVDAKCEIPGGLEWLG